MKPKYNSTQEIFNALLNGRHLSQLNCGEFMVEDMRTIVSHLKPRYIGTHELQSRWITSPVRGSRIKEWWLTERT